MSERDEAQLDEDITEDDGCPKWADTLILEMRRLEVLLGNIPESVNWQVQRAGDIHRRVFSDDPDAAQTEARVERIFEKVAEKLREAEYTPAQIVDFINARVSYLGGPPYCDESEVREALGE